MSAFRGSLKLRVKAELRLKIRLPTSRTSANLNIAKYVL